MQTSIKLPIYIDELIFNKLNAKYEPDYTKFNKNLHLNQNENLIYLGTYFPRSYAESYLIFKNLFNNYIINKTYLDKQKINILDIGSGTGGNLSGLLMSIIKNLSNKININILAIDGNKEALEILQKIVFKIQIQYNLNISLNCQYISFENIDELYKNSKVYFENSYDVITTSKMINEILDSDNNAYYEFCDYYLPHLSNDGFLSIVDVTMKINSQFLPIILNKQVNKFIKNNTEDYKTIIPTSCYINEETCSQDCFTNNIFYISHSTKQNDMSKITYRILANKEFADNILDKIEIGCVVGQTQSETKHCHHTSEKNNVTAFKV